MNGRATMRYRDDTVVTGGSYSYWLQSSAGNWRSGSSNSSTVTISSCPIQ